MLKRLAWVIVASAICAPCQPNKAPQSDASHANPKIPTTIVVAPDHTDSFDHRPPWWHDTNEWLVVVGFLTFGVVIYQSIQTATAANATEDAVTAARDSYTLAESTAKRQLRAYMVVRNAHLILREDGFVEAKMELANCGQTPAYDLRGGTLCRFTNYPVQQTQPMPDSLRQSQSTIGAGLAFWILAPGGRHDRGDREHLLRKLSAEDGNLVYCANGYFSYRDIFQDPHWIKFQMIVGGPAGVRLDTGDTHQWAASFCNDSEGNEEDQQAQKVAVTPGPARARRSPRSAN